MPRRGAWREPDGEHGLAVFLEGCDGTTIASAQVVDLKTRALAGSLPGWDWQQLPLSPDGTSFVGQEVAGQGHDSGPLAVADVRTGSVKVELQGLCRWNDLVPTHPEQQPGCKPYPQTPFPFAERTLRWSPDGSMIAAVNQVDQDHQLIAVWDARTGRLLHADPMDTATDPHVHAAVDTLFSPILRQLIIAHPDGTIEALSTDTWATTNTGRLDQSIVDLRDLGLVGYSADGSSLIAIAGLSGGGGGATLVWIDPTTLTDTQISPNPDIATPKGVSLSPDGSSLATGATDGSVRIWDAATGVA